MDKRRLNTGEVISSGILNIKAPESKASQKVNYAIVDECKDTAKSLQEGLEQGGLTATMYYGCWKIWATNAGFSGELMQYRAITESFNNKPLAYALGKAEEWMSKCFG